MLSAKWKCCLQFFLALNLLLWFAGADMHHPSLNIKSPALLPLGVWNPPATGGFHTPRGSNVESISISMASYKTAVTPLLTHWSYCSLALNRWYVAVIMTSVSMSKCKTVVTPLLMHWSDYSQALSYWYDDIIMTPPFLLTAMWKPYPPYAAPVIWMTSWCVVAAPCEDSTNSCCTTSGDNASWWVPSNRTCHCSGGH